MNVCWNKFVFANFIVDILLLTSVSTLCTDNITFPRDSKYFIPFLVFFFQIKYEHAHVFNI